MALNTVVLRRRVGSAAWECRKLVQIASWPGMFVPLAGQRTVHMENYTWPTSVPAGRFRTPSSGAITPQVCAMKSEVDYPILGRRFVAIGPTNLLGLAVDGIPRSKRAIACLCGGTDRCVIAIWKNIAQGIPHSSIPITRSSQITSPWLIESLWKLLYIILASP